MFYQLTFISLLLFFLFLYFHLSLQCCEFLFLRSYFNYHTMILLFQIIEIPFVSFPFPASTMRVAILNKNKCCFFISNESKCHFGLDFPLDSFITVDLSLVVFSLFRFFLSKQDQNRSNTWQTNNHLCFNEHLN